MEGSKGNLLPVRAVAGCVEASPANVNVEQDVRSALQPLPALEVGVLQQSLQEPGSARDRHLVRPIG
jgi:hypothetical protein